MDKIRNNVDFFRNDLIVDLFNSIDLGVHILDFNGTTVLYNIKCEEIEGMESTWIVGSDMNLLVRDGVYSESVGLEAIEKEERVSKVQKVNEKYIYSSAVPIFEGDKLINVIVSVVDMTSMEELKEKLEEVEFINTKIQKELELLKVLDSEKDPLIARSKAMEDIKQLAVRIAQVDSNVLIEGESGVGKGILSKFIHNSSSRKKGPFIKVDCGSLSPSLIESELFGYEKGSFTGAKKDGDIGLIELSQGGTLFLDEIGELPLDLQVKLLSVIQEKRLQKVGGTEYIDIDTRIIAATNRNLLKMVENGEFRVDLYYRLKVVYIEIPPLRDRREDIYPLIQLVLKEINEKYGFNKYISSQAIKVLLSYDWPGNVREIENEIERLVVTSPKNIIKEEDILSGSLGGNLHKKIGPEKSFRENVLQYEKKLLEEYLSKSSDIHELSEKTGFENSTLRKKAKRLGVELNYGK